MNKLEQIKQDPEKMITTLDKIKAHDPCEDGWKKLLTSLNKTEADDEPLTFKHILESNGLNDCIWAMRAAPEYDKEWRLFAVWCARQVQHLMKDERSIAALDVSKKFANRLATQEELAAARDAARAAAWAAAWAAARDAAGAAGDAARAAAWAAAWAAAGAAARAAAWAAAWAAAGAARDAGEAAGEAQYKYLSNLFNQWTTK